MGDCESMGESGHVAHNGCWASYLPLFGGCLEEECPFAQQTLQG